MQDNEQISQAALEAVHSLMHKDEIKPRFVYLFGRMIDLENLNDDDVDALHGWVSSYV